ncbi:GNAT family N-acetyltransferase [Antricoccus suffuscus]|nr:GNAT family N-acetyltransferase [Antricoccus suffuscus]
MRPDDLAQVVKIAKRAYKETFSDLQESRGIEPWSDRRADAEEGERITSLQLAEHILKTDPETCLVLEESGSIKAAVMAMNREGMFVMSLTAVAPKAQGKGYAQSLMQPMHQMVDTFPRSLGVVRADETIRFLFPWNYDVHPAMRAEGAIDRGRLPVIRSVRDGDDSDRELCVTTDRRLRGASRGPDHDLLAASSRLFVAEQGTAYGYAYAHPNGSPLTVAASSTALARELLVGCLASGESGSVALVRNITSEQRWAFDVVRRLGMSLHLAGPVVVRGMALPAPYLPHDALG